MPFQVYEEGLEEAREELTALLRATRKVPISERRIEWLYRDNPDGRAVIWTVRQQPTQQLAGFTAALPRRMAVDGEVRLCWNCADFSIAPRFRTLGVAADLRRAASREINAGRATFLFAHPNEKMQLIHERVGHTPVGRMVRYAKILNYTPYLKRALPLPRINSLMAGAVDRLLRALDRCHRYSSDCSLSWPGRFDHNFDELFWRIDLRGKIVGVRDAAYLNWRYCDNPVYESSLMTATQNSRLRGYAVFTIQDEMLHIKDIFAEGEAVSADLLASLVAHGRKLGLSSVSFVTLESNPLVTCLKKFRFVRRPPDSTMFMHIGVEDELRDLVANPDNWYLTVGDRDI